MRRSGWIVTLGVLGICLMIRSRYQEPPESDIPRRVGVYPTVAACVASGNDTGDCERAFAATQAAYRAQAPHYPTRDACERIGDVDSCVPVSMTDDKAGYMPVMTGFALASAFGLAHSLPVYYDKQGFGRVFGTNNYVGRRCDRNTNDACNDQPGYGGSSSAGGGGGGGYYGGGGGSRTAASSQPLEPMHRVVTRGGFGLHLGGFHFGG